MTPFSYFDAFASRYEHYKDGRWCYEDGCIYRGLVLLHKATGEARWRDHLLRLTGPQIAPDGALQGFDPEEFNIDNILAGRCLFHLADETGDPRYMAAADRLAEQLAAHPRTQAGNYWHKKRYPEQVWLDGIYMGLPFQVEYAQRRDRPELIDDAMAQMERALDLTAGPAGLYVHGYDAVRAQDWADPETGRSAAVWARAVGWLAMALVDLAELVPERAPLPRTKALLDAIVAQQAPSGLWPQVLDAPDPAQMEDAPDLGYRPVPHGLQIPDGLEMGAPSSVVWTSRNQLVVFNRGPNPLMAFEADGTFVRAWGQGGEYIRPHGMRLDPDGNIWTTDVNGHTVRKMTLDGEVLLTIGTHGQAGDATDGLLNEPTDLTINAAGEVFVLVGHGRGEPRLVKFDRTGKLMTSWGGPGTGPGKFDTPHSIVVDQAGLLYVADRQNRRVQIFDDEGTYIKEWAFKGLPCGLHLHNDQQMYLASGFAGEILRLDENGKALGRTGQPGKGLGEFGEAHYMTMAPNGDIWVADTVRPALHRFVKK